ncbi:hypothetical protein DFJ74DRAFT_444845 [Hyaloraphidium curvatum]|nr:hypothetical protein DFJ74DRAFT_444845 [Hyaloraphidium curvatum]
MKIDALPGPLLRDPLLGAGFAPPTPTDLFDFGELGGDGATPAADDIDYDAAARQLLEAAGFSDAALPPPAPLNIELDISAVLEANRRRPAPSSSFSSGGSVQPITLAGGASVIPPGPPAWSTRPMVGEQRAHGERHRGLVMPRVVPSRAPAAPPATRSPASATSSGNADELLPNLTLDRINAESRLLLAQLLSGITAPLMMPQAGAPAPLPEPATVDPRGLGGLPTGPGGLAASLSWQSQDSAMLDRDALPADGGPAYYDLDAEGDDLAEIKPDPEEISPSTASSFHPPAPTRARKPSASGPSAAKSRAPRSRAKPAPASTSSSAPKRSRSTPSKRAATPPSDPSDASDDEDPLQEIHSLIASQHAHRGAPPHASNQPVGATEDLQARLDEDDLAKEGGAKGLTSKERRQLRNKISARNFRARRKEYISTLEQQLLSLSSVHARLQEQNRLLRRHLGSLTSGAALVCDTCGGDALRLSEQAEGGLELQAEEEERRVVDGRAAAGVPPEPGAPGTQKGKKVARVPAEVAGELQRAIEDGRLRLGPG